MSNVSEVIPRKWIGNVLKYEQLKEHLPSRPVNGSYSPTLSSSALNPSSTLGTSMLALNHSISKKDLRARFTSTNGSAETNTVESIEMKEISHKEKVGDESTINSATSAATSLISSVTSSTPIDNFTSSFEHELERVNNFYLLITTSYQEALTYLETCSLALAPSAAPTETIIDIEDEEQNPSTLIKESIDRDINFTQLPITTPSQLSKAYYLLHHELIQLQSFCLWNIDRFLYLLSLYSSNTSSTSLPSLLHSQDFSHFTTLSDLLVQVENNLEGMQSSDISRKLLREKLSSTKSTAIHKIHVITNNSQSSLTPNASSNSLMGSNPSSPAHGVSTLTNLPHTFSLSHFIHTFNWKNFSYSLRVFLLFFLLFWVLLYATGSSPRTSSLANTSTVTDEDEFTLPSTNYPPEEDEESKEWLTTILPIYRGLGCLILLGWLWGVNLLGWSKYKINFVYLMDFDPRTFTPPGAVFNTALNLTIIYLANFLVFLKMNRNDIPPFMNINLVPISMFAYMVFKFLPWPWNPPSKMWSNLFQVILSPFGRVTFFSGYVGDVLTSLVKVLIDLAYTSCFVFSFEWYNSSETLVPAVEDDDLNPSLISDNMLNPSSSAVSPLPAPTCANSFYFKRVVMPLISALPLWFRFMQCLRRYFETRKRWPHLGNAGKYAVAHSVVLFGIFHSSTFQKEQVEGDTYWFKMAWISCMVFSTLYTFSWDVFVDWGLGDFKRARGLRTEMMFPSKSFYYICIFVDLFMRFTWTITLIPQGEDSPFSPEFILFLQPMLASGELCRRCMWAMLRLEWEHLSVQVFRKIEMQSTEANAHTSNNTTQNTQPLNPMRVILEVVALATVVLFVGTVAAFTSA